MAGVTKPLPGTHMRTEVLGRVITSLLMVPEGE